MAPTSMQTQQQPGAATQGGAAGPLTVGESRLPRSNWGAGRSRTTALPPGDGKSGIRMGGDLEIRDVLHPEVANPLLGGGGRPGVRKRLRGLWENPPLWFDNSRRLRSGAVIMKT